MEMTKHVFCGLDLLHDWQSQAVMQSGMDLCWQIQWFEVLSPVTKAVLQILCGFVCFFEVQCFGFRAFPCR